MKDTVTLKIKDLERLIYAAQCYLEICQAESETRTPFMRWLKYSINKAVRLYKGGD